jgi:hypothetical protein
MFHFTSEKIICDIYQLKWLKIIFRFKTERRLEINHNRKTKNKLQNNESG